MASDIRNALVIPAFGAPLPQAPQVEGGTADIYTAGVPLPRPDGADSPFTDVQAASSPAFAATTTTLTAALAPPATRSLPPRPSMLSSGSRITAGPKSSPMAARSATL